MLGATLTFELRRAKKFLAASRAAALGIAIRRRHRRRIISHAQCKLQFSLQITILIVNYNPQCKLQCLM